MKIAHISTYDSGGAGLAAKAVSQYFKSMGYDSVLYVKKSRCRQGNDTKVIAVSYFKDALRRLAYKLIRWVIDDKYLFFGILDRHFECADRLWLEALNDKDVIFIYWISNFTTLSQLARVLKKFPEKKIYVVNFDMANYTGGCHYSFGCDSYKRGCDDCPAAFSTSLRELVRQNHLEKTIAISSLGAESLSFTNFVKKQAQDAGVNFLVNHLFALPVTASDFFPTANTHNYTIFVGAYAPNDKRKGFDLLCRVLLALSRGRGHAQENYDRKIKLLFPSGTDLPEFIVQDYDIEFYPFATNNSELNKVYNRASLFLNTTLDDSGPVMVLQAMLAGLPMVSHRIGYAADLVVENENGILVEYLDITGYVAAITEVLEHWNVSREKREMIHIHAKEFSESLPPLLSHIQNR